MKVVWPMKPIFCAEIWEYYLTETDLSTVMSSSYLLPNLIIFPNLTRTSSCVFHSVCHKAVSHVAVTTDLNQDTQQHPVIYYFRTITDSSILLNIIPASGHFEVTALTSLNSYKNLHTIMLYSYVCKITNTKILCLL